MENRNQNYQDNTLDEIIKIIKKNWIDPKDILKYLDENSKNNLRSKDLILFGDI